MTSYQIGNVFGDLMYDIVPMVQRVMMSFLSFGMYVFPM